MRVAVFNTKNYDKQFLQAANALAGHELTFFDVHLTPHTYQLAYGFPCVSVFVNDIFSRDIIKPLAEKGLKLIALRCAGFNQVDLQAAEENGVMVARVPAYSPQGVAEHAVALMLALNRKICRANSRVHDGNFALDGLLGFEIFGRTVGIMGTGEIGRVLAKIMLGFGAKVIAYDPYEHPDCLAQGVRYVTLPQLYAESDIISLHMPLTKETFHIINADALKQMKSHVMLINTSRGGLIDTASVIDALKAERIGYLGLDVYEEEGDLFFEDLSGHIIKDDVFARLLTFPNVLITGHQAFFTREALSNIAQTTIDNITAFHRGEISARNVVSHSLIVKK